MKMIFLLFGMTAFCSAPAQQKDVFDINRHIGDLLIKKQGALNNVKPYQTNTFYSYKNAEPPAQLSYTLPNGNNVYTLSVDNMPCIVPGFPQANIPNVSNRNVYYDSPLFKNDTPGSIPNAVKPYRLIASN